MQTQLRRLKGMGKEIEFAFYTADSQIIDLIFPDIEAEERRLEKIFNFYDKESELSILNQKRELEVSKELLEVITLAFKFAKLTDGKYDPSLGKYFLERKSGKQSTNPECSFRDIEIKENKITLKNPNVMIDLGSIAKGYIVDKLINFISSKGVESFLIDARGDIRNFGEVSEILSIQDPRNKEKTMENFTLKNQAVATSGDYHQFSGNFKNSHILNAKDFSSVTVIANTLAEADVLASVFFVSGEEKLSQISKNFPNVKVFAVRTADNSVITYNW